MQTTQKGKMSSSAHYRHRADRLRFALISTPNPVAAARLRSFVAKYKTLAERADKMIDSPPLDTVGQEHALTEKYGNSD